MEEGIPKLTDVISEEVLRIFLQGFYKKTGLAVSIYVDPDHKEPIHNKNDCNLYCKKNRSPWNPEGCLEHNVILAREILEIGKIKDLTKLRTCISGLCHWAEVIRSKASKTPVAVAYFGGVVIDKKDLMYFREIYHESLYMEPREFNNAKKFFIELIKDLEFYYNSHIQLVDNINYKAMLGAHRSIKSISSEFPDFTDSIYTDIDSTLNKILEFLNSWTESKLSGLFILDRQTTNNSSNNEILVVRRIVGIKELEQKYGEDLHGPEIFALKGSFFDKAIKERKPVYEDDIKSRDFKWNKAVSKLNTKKALALPLVLKQMDKVIGGLICFPGKEIWKTEIPVLENFANKIAVSIHLAIRNVLYRRNQKFNEGLMEIVVAAGDEFYQKSVNLIRDTLAAEAASIFILDRNSGYLKLAGTADSSENSSKLIGANIYKQGEGIAGNIAQKIRNKPYGEIIYDISNYPSYIGNFREEVPETKSGKHSMIITQVCSPDGEILGVIRCVDIQPRSESVFNCFNHYDLESLQFWAGILGIIYKLKESMKKNHEFNLSFIHEFGTGIGGIINNLELLRKYLKSSSDTKTHKIIDDALMMAEIISQYSDDIKISSMIAAKGEYQIDSPKENWYYLKKDFLLPLKFFFLEQAQIERNIEINFNTISARIFVDKRLVVQVFANILKNAIKYSFDPKNPNTSDENIADIEIAAYLDENRRLLIDFRNYGIGINNDEKETIFNLYRKGRNVGSQSAGGLGIGLFVCREIMNKHDGGISIKRCDNPTIVTIWFPSFRVISM
ncbi:MAG: hypothetical protein GY839_16545 [candidate division Zixibacteria bacterium]|nr:hypothetical protein [candidate division Zixibacteria bacterium]